MKRSALALLGLMLFSGAAAAQQTASSAPPEANPVSNALRSTLDRQSKNIISAAEEMPADKYSFRPTPAQMSFGELIEHITGSNNFYCSKISGAAAPAGEKLAASAAKDKLIEVMKASFDFCKQSLAKVDDSKLGESLTLFGGQPASRAATMMRLAASYSDHYGMAAMYLRLNGLLPPTAQKKD